MGVGLWNEECLAEQTGTSLGMGTVEHGSSCGPLELEMMLLYWQRFSTGPC